MIKSAEFVTSVANYKKLYESNFPEIAFVGRSNVGKSSLLNYITNNKKLAKTSSTPGRTRLINYFLINNDFLLVDLPGYGYAATSKAVQDNWGELMEQYLIQSKNLKVVYMLLDIRRIPSKQDEQMVEFLYFYNIPTVFVLTKSDKLSKAQQNKQASEIANFLGLTQKNLIITSAEKKEGQDIIVKDIETRLAFLHNPMVGDELASQEYNDGLEEFEDEE